jgi:hypothetical protein
MTPESCPIRATWFNPAFSPHGPAVEPARAAKRADQTSRRISGGLSRASLPSFTTIVLGVPVAKMISLPEKPRSL